MIANNAQPAEVTQFDDQALARVLLDQGVKRIIESDQFGIRGRAEIERVFNRDLCVLAAAFLSLPAQQMSRFSSVMGTPKYMSPEQCRGERLDKSSDVYSLGVIAYQMLAGEPPFTGTTPGLLIRHREANPAPLREKRKEIPAGLDGAVRQALAKDKNARPATAGAFAFLLQLRSAGNQWVRQQADALCRQSRWKFIEISLRTQWKGWLLSLLLMFATLKLPGMSPAMSIAVFGLLWLVIAAIIIWGQNATTAACALFIEQAERNPKTDLRSIVAGVRRRRRDLARAGFRLIIPPLVHEGLSVEEAKGRLDALTAPIRRQTAYTLFRRVLVFALALTVSQQILTASAFLLDKGHIYFNITRDVFLHDMSNSMFFWLPTAVTIGIAAFGLCAKSAIEQSVIYLAARKALGEISSERFAFLPDSETWSVRWRQRWKTYAPACAIIVLIIGFHLSKFPWMAERMRYADLYSIKALHASGAPVPQRLDRPDFEIPVFIRSPKLTQYLIEKGMDVNAPFRMGRAVLLDAGCDVNAADNKGRTPLIYAVASERSAVIELLLKGGANIHAKDRNGESALDWARKIGNEEIITLLTTFSSSGEKKTSQ